MTNSVAIIGGGQAGGTLAQALRQRGFTGPVTLVSAETTPPYERPPLSKGVLVGDDLTHVVPADFYAQNNVDIRLGRRATEVRRDDLGLEVVLESAPPLNADTVVLATGSRPRAISVPGMDLENVVSLNTIADAWHIRNQLSRLERVVIAGAGFVGTEVAASLRGLGCDVVLVEPAPQPATRLGPWAAEAVRELHEAAGVRFVQDVLAAAEGDTRVQRVVTAGGEVLPCDLLLVAVGSAPNLEVAANSGLDCAEGIVCDDRGRTSMADVYAVGDAASWPYGPLGRLRVEHFRTAIDHAQVVAGDILGGPAEGSSLVPWFWTDQYQHRFEVAGRPDQGTTEVRRHGPAGRPYLSLHLRDDRLVGAIGLDRPRDVRAASQLIRTQVPVSPDLLGDPSIDLRKAAVPA
ncbi:FAD-dependent oxidoreductase [Streptomyces sp. NPDC005811]|uniref:NAD(P)/FAD-dependent oxidoreductase n=1 Tax=Streptomyces sp. NPDC005811 TaxID=3154565 RepID=UPI0033D99F01